MIVYIYYVKFTIWGFPDATHSACPCYQPHSSWWPQRPASEDYLADVFWPKGSPKVLQCPSAFVGRRGTDHPQWPSSPASGKLWVPQEATWLRSIRMCKLYVSSRCHHNSSPLTPFASISAGQAEAIVTIMILNKSISTLNSPPN